jgi:hypothetical protein
LTRTLGYVWLLLLGLALLVSAAGAHERSLAVAERAGDCDAFGYLRMAREVRRAASDGRLPDYGLESAHTRLLIDHLRSQGLPPSAWGEMVAPHAHHYFPRADRVGVQYPPGTGWLLALFPEGEAVHGLNRAVIVLFLAAGLAALVVAGRRRAWAAAGGVVFALQLGLDVLGAVGDASFSVNAVLAPLLLSFSALFLALVLAAKPRASGLAAFAGGACFGLAVLVRLPVLLLLPGALVLLHGGGRRPWVNRTLAFGAGLLLCGVLPLLAHQQQVAGAWYLPTYGHDDASPPSLAVLTRAVPFYLGDGPGGGYNRTLLPSLAGAAGLAVLTRRGGDERPPLGWGRLGLSVLALWGVPMTYFLTHRVPIWYYQVPATFAAVVVLALGGLTMECLAPPPAAGAPGGPWRWLALAAALFPGLGALERSWECRPATFPPAEARARRLDVPVELADERAWVFADRLTGPLWYEAEKPAHKVPFANTRTRAVVYRFVFERGEPQYVIRDSPDMQAILDEIERMGGTLEPRGEVDGCPYFLVRWPSTGPAVPVPDDGDSR